MVYSSSEKHRPMVANFQIEVYKYWSSISWPHTEIFRTQGCTLVNYTILHLMLHNAFHTECSISHVHHSLTGTDVRRTVNVGLFSRCRILIYMLSEDTHRRMFQMLLQGFVFRFPFMNPDITDETWDFIRFACKQCVLIIFCCTLINLLIIDLFML
jgi:hypothetical protein